MFSSQNAEIIKQLQRQMEYDYLLLLYYILSKEEEINDAVLSLQFVFFKENAIMLKDADHEVFTEKGEVKYCINNDQEVIAAGGYKIRAYRCVPETLIHFGVNQVEANQLSLRERVIFAAIFGQANEWLRLKYQKRMEDIVGDRSDLNEDLRQKLWALYAQSSQSINTPKKDFGLKQVEGKFSYEMKEQLMHQYQHDIETHYQEELRHFLAILKKHDLFAEANSLIEVIRHNTTFEQVSMMHAVRSIFENLNDGSIQIYQSEIHKLLNLGSNNDIAKIVFKINQILFNKVKEDFSKQLEVEISSLDKNKFATLNIFFEIITPLINNIINRLNDIKPDTADDLINFISIIHTINKLMNSRSNKSFHKMLDQITQKINDDDLTQAIMLFKIVIKSKKQKMVVPAEEEVIKDDTLKQLKQNITDKKAVILELQRSISKNNRRLQEILQNISTQVPINHAKKSEAPPAAKGRNRYLLIAFGIGFVLGAASLFALSFIFPVIPIVVITVGFLSSAAVKGMVIGGLTLAGGLLGGCAVAGLSYMANKATKLKAKLNHFFAKKDHKEEAAREPAPSTAKIQNANVLSLVGEKRTQHTNAELFEEENRLISNNSTLTQQIKDELNQLKNLRDELVSVKTQQQNLQTTVSENALTLFQLSNPSPQTVSPANDNTVETETTSIQTRTTRHNSSSSN